MKPSVNLSLNELTNKLSGVLELVKRYRLLLFFLLVASLYGFILFRISILANAEPSPEAVTSQVEAVQVPRIDEKVVQQLESLEDNSSGVRSLFNQARSNPFN